jgi:hypothetical protein
MTPERAAELVARWVRFYTLELPAPVGRRRVDEIDADLHEHIAHERARGTSDRRISLSILSRMTRGVIADAAWRQEIRPLRGDLMKSYVAILAIALAVAALGVVAVMHGESDDAPGLVLVGILLIVGAFAYGVRTAQRSSK